MLYFKDNKDGYYQFDDDANPMMYAHLTPTAQQFPPNPTADEVKERFNAPIQAKMDKADQKVIRALVDGDTVRIDAHKVSQAALAATLRP